MRAAPTARCAAAVAAVGALVACGSNGGDSSESDADDIALQNTTEPGSTAVDEVNWALPTGEPTTINPFAAGAESENTVVANLCENTLRLRPDFSVAADSLAESARWVDDTTFVIDLREGVTFWDGSPLTAEDALYSYRRTADPEAESIYAGVFGRVESMEVTGPLQVTLHFATHDAQFRAAIASAAGVIVQRDFAEQAGGDFGNPDTGVMCTGPYRLDAWNPGESVVVTANGDYWGEPPLVDTLNFEFISDTNTLTSALQAGEIDGAYNVPVSSASSLRTADSGRLLFGPSTASLSFGPTSSTGPAANPRVREALDLAIDKDAVVDGVLQGYGEPLKTFTPPFAYNGLPAAEVYQAGYEALPSNAQDLDRARELVEEAGVGEEPLTMVLPAGNTVLSRAGTVVQESAAEIGVTVELQQMQPTEFSALFYDPALREGADLILTTGYIEVPGALYYAPEFVRQGGLFNWSGYDNPEAAELIEQATAASDPTRTAEHFVAAQELFAPDRLQVSLASIHNTLYLSGDLTGVPVSIAHLSSPWAARLGGVS